ncbi:DISARM system phospholipase D-like protein DrmC [Azovibrio restrictus]|uniref:DISARM system phospholipase D-like protein DrmC n=1 Tax=Azovibrio restrictus TaxID=146938 RepID=UPI0026F2F325|nr:DISARM system phospholipase D-like protein DrmC [Azovibrio restrictus]
MEKLIEAVTELVGLVSPTKVRAIADRVRGSKRGTDASTIRSIVGTPAARTALDRMLEAWEESGLSGDVLTGMLVGAAHARKTAVDEQSVELVWTGPTTSFVATRRTDQVLLDIVRGAQRDLFLVSFIAFDVPQIVHALNEATARGIEVRMLLESSIGHGGSLLVDPIATMHGSVPRAGIYAWRHKPGPHVDGRVHAKLAVADGRDAFITSANLTGHALDKNMEVGLVIRGGPVPAGLRSHLHALIDTGIIDRAY